MKNLLSMVDTNTLTPLQPPTLTKNGPMTPPTILHTNVKEWLGLIEKYN